MRKEYGKVLREAFARRLAERLPRFKPVRTGSDYLFPGERVFCWAVSGDLHLYVILTPDQRGHDAFTVELGWSRLGRFPELSMRPNIMGPALDGAEFARDEAVVRLPYLTGIPEWWTVEEIPDPLTLEALMEQQRKRSPAEAEAQVQPLLTEAMDSLETAGVEFFRAFLRQAGFPDAARDL